MFGLEKRSNFSSRIIGWFARGVSLGKIEENQLHRDDEVVDELVEPETSRQIFEE